MKEKFSTRVLAEIAIFAAIGFALDALQSGIFRGVWVNGGSVGIAMIPVFIIAYRRGLVPGLLCGLILSLVQMLGGIYIMNAATFDNKFIQVMGPFIQVMLDYVLAYFLVGFAGAFAGLYKNAESMKMKILCHAQQGKRKRKALPSWQPSSAALLPSRRCTRKGTVPC